MKFQVIAFFSLIVMIGLVDLFCYLIYNKEIKQSKLSKIIANVLFLIVPFIFIVGYAGAAAYIKNANSPSFFDFFMWMNAFCMMIYIPKTFVLFYYGLLALVNRIVDNVRAKKSSLAQTTRKYPKISRSKFLSQLGIIFATLPFFSVLFGIHKGRFAFFTRHQRINFPNLPTAFDGFKIVQISDIHLGSFSSNYHKLEGIVDIINGEHPDVILFTGDLVNNFAEETYGWDGLFQQLNAKFGKFSILGNHDYGDYSKWASPEAKATNFNEIVNAHQKFGFRLLRNQSVSLAMNGQEVALTGVENWGHPPFPQYGDLNAAKKGTENMAFKILMSHDPDHWDAEVIGKTNFDLTLAGHTHGMQFGIDWKGIKWSPAQYKFKRWDGLYKQGNQFLYVNRGLGYLGMPARIGMAPEITVIQLHKGPVGTEPM